jgi:hypothetical protein
VGATQGRLTHAVRDAIGYITATIELRNPPTSDSRTPHFSFVENHALPEPIGHAHTEQFSLRKTRESQILYEGMDLPIVLHRMEFWRGTASELRRRTRLCMSQPSGEA